MKEETKEYNCESFKDDSITGVCLFDTQQICLDMKDDNRDFEVILSKHKTLEFANELLELANQLTD